MNKKIIQRRIIEKIEVFLKTDDILLLYWARQVGKTTIMKFIQQKLLYDKTYFFDLENIEYLQTIVLKEIYEIPECKDLIFYGGTSLRFIFDLNRLSEDLDFIWKYLRFFILLSKT